MNLGPLIALFCTLWVEFKSKNSFPTDVDTDIDGNYSRYFWFKYDFGQKYHALQVRPDRGLKS